LWHMSPITIRLREVRESKAISQAELARRAGVTRATINRIENARVTSIDLVVLEKLADALDIDAALLLVHRGRRP
jgi:transcriptional regulator with XRE-family HTH domain